MTKRQSLLSVADLGRSGIERVLELADTFAEVSDRPIPKVPTLRGRTVATLFFESSTRTRLSFETAAKRLSADTASLQVATSSVQKGESLRDTAETLDAMGVDAIVIRHPASGAPRRVADWVDAAVINAGDGEHEHPTQALLDCYTMREALGLGAERSGFEGLRVAIVGDARHSRVCRSNVLALGALGATVTLVAPRTLLPASLEGWPVTVSSDLDEVLPETDVCYVLRLQAERMREALFPSLHEYRERFGLTEERARCLAAGAVVMHPGPMNRGVEIDDAVASSVNALVARQVRNGVAVRMAVLYLLLGGPAEIGLDDGFFGPEPDLAGRAVGFGG
jgi:aspartate carbamoyltransferase catalytic subunit